MCTWLEIVCALFGCVIGRNWVTRPHAVWVERGGFHIYVSFVAVGERALRFCFRRFLFELFHNSPPIIVCVFHLRLSAMHCVVDKNFEKFIFNEVKSLTIKVSYAKICKHQI